MTQRTCLPRLVVVTVVVIGSASPANADIFQWEYINPADPSQGKQQSTTLAPNGAGVDAVPGTNLSGRNLTMAYLIGADLTNANLSYFLIDVGYGIGRIAFNSDLTAADFTGAEVRGANFERYAYFPNFGTGITLAQLYSTSSYQAGDLSGIVLDNNMLYGGNFSGQDLSNAKLRAAELGSANFRHANLANVTFVDPHRPPPGSDYYGFPAELTNADFTAADARGSDLFTLLLVKALNSGLVFRLVGEGATATNTIGPYGHIDGLNLDGSALLVVRDHDSIPITVDQHLAMGPGGTLRMVFEADAWDSTISFASGIPVTLGGTLELTFADNVNLASQVGRTFHLFNWTGVTPVGAFAVSSPYAWDLSNLYATGQVTLTAVPEPHPVLLISLILSALAPTSRLRSHFRSGKGQNQ